MFPHIISNSELDAIYSSYFSLEDASGSASDTDSAGSSLEWSSGMGSNNKERAKPDGNSFACLRSRDSDSDFENATAIAFLHM